MYISLSTYTYNLHIACITTPIMDCWLVGDRTQAISHFLTKATKTRSSLSTAEPWTPPGV